MISYMTFIGLVAGFAVLLFFAVDYYEFTTNGPPDKALKVLRLVIVMLALLVILARTIVFMQQTVSL